MPYINGKYYDPYDILKINRGCSEKEIKSAYRKLSKLYHPDSRPGFEEEFQLVNASYNEIEKGTIYRYQSKKQNNESKDKNDIKKWTDFISSQIYKFTIALSHLSNTNDLFNVQLKKMFLHVIESLKDCQNEMSNINPVVLEKIISYKMNNYYIELKQMRENLKILMMSSYGITFYTKEVMELYNLICKENLPIVDTWNKKYKDFQKNYYFTKEIMCKIDSVMTDFENYPYYDILKSKIQDKYRVFLDSASKSIKKYNLSIITMADNSSVLVKFFKDEILKIFQNYEQFLAYKSAEIKMLKETVHLTNNEELLLNRCMTEAEFKLEKGSILLDKYLVMYDKKSKKIYNILKENISHNNLKKLSRKILKLKK